MITRLLVLVAVLLMPIDMAAAGATPLRHSDSAEMPMGHCPDNTPMSRGKAGIVECTMACSAALPAADVAADAPIEIVCQRLQPSIAQRLDGLHPETATPPPKRT